MKFIRSYIKLFIIFALFGLNSFFVWTFINSEKPADFNNITEIKALTGKEDFSTLKDFFTDLAERKGAVYAYEALKIAPVAPGTDMHLMGHVVGEILYKQKGASGMEYCTHDFRNACSHTIAVGLFSEKGIGALPDIADACKKAPGGRGAYNMCFHGLGHGILSYLGYDYEKTVEVCSSIKKAREDGRESTECVGGATMEIISGGDHDKELWTPMNEKYMQTEDALYPCNADFVPNSAKSICYTYLTPQLIVHAGGDLANPTDKDFEKAFTFCDALPENDPNRKVCYAGFGKDFLVLAKARDIRKIEDMTDSELKKVESWCYLANEDVGRVPCIISALNSLYWGGENDRRVSIRFCTVLQNEDDSEKCFGELINNVNYYINDATYKKSFCRELPDTQTKYCEEKLL